MKMNELQAGQVGQALKATPDIETGIDEDGIVEDCEYDTHYVPLLDLTPAGNYLRVLADSDGIDVETRIPYSLLAELGLTTTPTD